MPSLRRHALAKVAIVAAVAALAALALDHPVDASYGGWYRIPSPCANAISSVTINSSGTVAILCAGDPNLYLGQIHSLPP